MPKKQTASAKITASAAQKSTFLNFLKRNTSRGRGMTLHQLKHACQNFFENGFNIHPLLDQFVEEGKLGKDGVKYYYIKATGSVEDTGKKSSSARKPGDNIVAVAGPSKVSKSSKKEELSSKSVGYPAKTDSTSGESASEGSESDDDSNAESDDDTSEDIRVANEEMKIIRRNEEVQVSIGRRPPRGLLEISKTGALKFDSFPEDSEEETSD